MLHVQKARFCPRAPVCGSRRHVGKIARALCDCIEAAARDFTHPTVPNFLANLHLTMSDQKSGFAAVGIFKAAWFGKNELGFSAQINSANGPSGALANCAMRSIGILRTAA